MRIFDSLRAGARALRGSLTCPTARRTGWSAWLRPACGRSPDGQPARRPVRGLCACPRAVEVTSRRCSLGAGCLAPGRERPLSGHHRQRSAVCARHRTGLARAGERNHACGCHRLAGKKRDHAAGHPRSGGENHDYAANDFWQGGAADIAAGGLCPSREQRARRPVDVAADRVAHDPAAAREGRVRGQSDRAGACRGAGPDRVHDLTAGGPVLD